MNGALKPGSAGAVNSALTILALAERNIAHIIASGGPAPLADNAALHNALDRPMPLPLPFVLLMLSIAAVWLPPLRLGPLWRLPPWAVFYGAAVGLAWAQGVVDVMAVIALGVFVALAVLRVRAQAGRVQWLAHGGLLVAAGALVLHQVPGFDNPRVMDAVRFTPDATPYTQYLNFDKGSVGLVLLALVATRARRGDPPGRFALEGVWVLAGTCAVVFAIAVGLGMLRLEPKCPPQAALFLVVNLCFTCVAEEAIFRSLIQEPLRAGRWGQAAVPEAMAPSREWLAIAVSGTLFGLAHAAGGASMVLISAVAGGGYALAYARTGRIEVPLLVHAGLNAIHFFGFTYPALA